MSIKRLGNVLPVDQHGASDSREPVAGDVVPSVDEPGAEAPYDADAEAVAFVRFCYRRRAVKWPELYDEMCAVAARGDYNGMDYDQLRNVGIGFALAALPRLAELAARVIAEERSPQPMVAIA